MHTHAQLPGAGDDASQADQPVPADLAIELKRERRRRHELQALLELTLGAVSDAVVLVDEVGRVSWLNPAAARLSGRPAEELAGHTVHSLFATDRVSCSVLRDGAGEVVGAVYSAHDRSEERHLVEQLDEAEGRWRLLAELGDLLGRELDPLEALPHACRWLSKATSTSVAVILVSGSTIEGIVSWPPDDPAAGYLAGLQSRPLEPGSALWRTVRESRSVHLPAVQPATPLLSGVGTPESIRSASMVPLVARDTSLGALLVHAPESGGVPGRLATMLEEAAGRVALALANGQLRQTLSHLKEAQEAAHYREELLATASHDMQTPLAVLLGSVKALQGGGSLPPVQRALLYERMARRGAQLRRLVQQFLDYSRLEAGRPIVVRPCLSDVGAAISSVEAVVAGRCTLVVDMPDGLPLAYVDLDRLEQILGNLASNAVKFSPEGSTISVVARATPETVEIEVVDRGRGMSPDDLARAFEKFHRGVGAEGTQGTGLGLYMSRALVEAQGGQLSADSALGRGTRFTVVLPRWPVAAPEATPS